MKLAGRYVVNTIQNDTSVMLYIKINYRANMLDNLRAIFALFRNQPPVTPSQVDIFPPLKGHIRSFIHFSIYYYLKSMGK